MFAVQAFAQHGAEDAVGDDDIVTQLRMRRNLLGDLIAAKDVQVGAQQHSLMQRIRSASRTGTAVAAVEVIWPGC